ncbi:MAG: zinc-dependent metalloprotease [Pirellulales bacterium]
MRLSLLRLSYLSLVVTVLGFTGWAVSPLLADEPTTPPADAAADKSDDKKPDDKKNEAAAGDVPPPAAAAAQAATPAAAAEKPKYRPIAEVLKDAQKIDGLLTLHRKDEELFVELKPTDFDRDFIVLITIAKGIGQTPILGGYSWGFGDDWVWQFRKSGERIHVVRRNVRFTADAGSPSAEAVKLAYTDSVLFSLPIATKSPSGSYIVSLAPVFMGDLPQISLALPGFSFSAPRSTWADVKGHPKNVEIQVAATYSSSGYQEIDSVADSRGVTINVHYSISHLPKTSYKPRLADDRVGYFLTVAKDFSKSEEEDRFVRYINRWNLEKADAKAAMSPPKEPIVFWLEKTIPFKYRKPIRDGIAEWNKAFEKAGYFDAIDVRQQPDDATWEPGDINYNTFRWITAGAGFAMGPSRVNPLTGEILDADIIFDSDFLQVWKQSYETFTPKGIEALTGGPIDLESYHAEQRRLPPYLRNSHSAHCACNLLSGVSHQLALAASVSAIRKRSPEEMDKLIMQALKEVTMHEVGHTLGLRHNFKASAFYDMSEVNDVAKTSLTGTTASVMDYNPINIRAKEETQGDFYSTTIGPYDYWAIEYGYKPIGGGNAEAELPELKKIAARSGEPGLAFATDEDTRGFDPDPHSFRFDMGKDLLEFATLRAKLVAEAMPGLVNEMTAEGDGYEKARRAFGVLLSSHGQAMYMMSRYIGGVEVSRSHKGDANAQPPFRIVDADKQRAALKMLGEHVFTDQPFNIPTEMYNQLAPSRWSHWGSEEVDRPDYPVHEVILMWQDRILARTLSPLTLSRIYDAEVKLPGDKDVFTTSELLRELTGTVFANFDKLAEGEFTDRKPAITSMRRNLQRSYLRQMSRLALNNGAAPEDCQSLAFLELTRLKSRIDGVLGGSAKLDDYTRAHLTESSARIAKVVDARMSATP